MGWRYDEEVTRGKSGIEKLSLFISKRSIYKTKMILLDIH